MNYMKYSLLILALICFNCGKIDNYKEPDAGVKGKILDSETKELIPAQSPNGAQVSLYESDSEQPIKFWTKLDGTFENSNVFSGNYKIIVSGPFITKAKDTVRMNIPGGEVIFEVEPFLRIKASAQLDGNKIHVKYTISKSKNTSNKLARYTIVYSNLIWLDVNNYVTRHLVNTESLDEMDILNKELSYTIENIDTNKDVYVRVGARTISTDYYNYSTILKIK